MKVDWDELKRLHANRDKDVWHWHDAISAQFPAILAERETAQTIPPGYALVRVEQVKDAREIVAKEYAADRHNARLYKAMDLLDMVLTAAAKGE